jgi:K+-sensing histidine kinase KdpD
MEDGQLTDSLGRKVNFRNAVVVMTSNVGAKAITDSRRSLGLGLALCRTIIAAHGGTITLSDNKPHGCIFTFTLPLGEVSLHE